MCPIQKVKNQSGFTLLESLLQLLIFALVLTVTPFIFPWYEKTKALIFAKDKIQLEVFLDELRQDLQNTQIVKPTGLYSNILELHYQDQQNEEKGFIYEYRYANQRIFRTTQSYGGNDIRLTEVKRVVFSYEKPILTVKIDFKYSGSEVRQLVAPFSSQ